MTYRIIIIPRWSGTSRSDWYPWLEKQLAASEVFNPVIAADLPAPDNPEIPAWTAGVLRLLGTDPAELAKTVLIGHSVGCRAVLYALAALPDGCRLYGTLCVAGWWEIDTPWESITPWIDQQPDLTRVRNACGKLLVLLSDNDQYTSDYARNAGLWKERLNAAAVIIPGAKHFNASEEPAVLDALNNLI